MSVVVITEGTLRSQSAWISSLELSESDFKDLVNARVFQAQSEDKYEIGFVGIIILNRHVLYAQPKFGQDVPFPLARTLQILRYYFFRSTLRTPKLDSLRNPEYGDTSVLREFDTLMGLRDWFNAHSIYRFVKSRRSSLGKPHWVKTMAKMTPLVVQGSVIYPDIITERSEGVFNDISALQVGTLSKLLQRYEMPIPPQLLQAEEATGVSVTQWPLDQKARDFFLRRLAKEQRDIFRTDILQLFTLLRVALDTQVASPDKSPQIFGTTAFYSVWEDACRCHLGNYLEEDGESLMGQPTWHYLTLTGEMNDVALRQIPDIVVRLKDQSFIIDAKYYYPFPQRRPGGPDIIKQLYYAESISDTKQQIRSVFLLPDTQSDEPRYLGYASIEGGSRLFKNVEAWGIHPKQLFLNYPSPSAGNSNAILDALISDRDDVLKVVTKTPAHV